MCARGEAIRELREAARALAGACLKAIAPAPADGAGRAAPDGRGKTLSEKKEPI